MSVEVIFFFWRPKRYIWVFYIEIQKLYFLKLFESKKTFWFWNVRINCCHQKHYGPIVFGRFIFNKLIEMFFLSVLSNVAILLTNCIITMGKKLEKQLVFLVLFETFWKKLCFVYPKFQNFYVGKISFFFFAKVSFDKLVVKVKQNQSKKTWNTSVRCRAGAKGWMSCPQDIGSPTKGYLMRDISSKQGTFNWEGEGGFTKEILCLLFNYFLKYNVLLNTTLI